MTPALTIAHKDIRLMLRDRPGLLFTVLFPLFFGLFFGAIYASTTAGDQAAIVLAFVDEAPGSNAVSARAFADRLETDPRIDLHRVPDTHSALEAVTTGRASALLLLPSDFDRWFNSLGAVGTGAPVLRMDRAGSSESSVVQGIVASALYRTVMHSLADPDAGERRMQLLRETARAETTDPETGMRLRAMAVALGSLSGSEASPGQEPAISIDVQPLARPGNIQPPNSFAITFPQAMMWAVLGCAATFAVGMVSERSAGTLLRLRTTPITAAQILGGKGIACAAVSLCVSLLFVLLGRVLFDVRPVSYPILILSLICVSFAFAGVMMMLAVLGRSKTSPGQLAWGVILIMAITGGGMLPLFFMPSWLVAISHFSPVKWGILAMEGGIWRGTSFAGMLTPLAILLGIGALGFAIGARSFVLSERFGSD